MDTRRQLFGESKYHVEPSYISGMIFNYLIVHFTHAPLNIWPLLQFYEVHSWLKLTRTYKKTQQHHKCNKPDAEESQK